MGRDFRRKSQGEGTFFKKSLPQLLSLPRIQPEADGDGVVDGGHGGGIEVSHFFSEAALVDGTYLFEEDHGILLETDLIGVYVDVGGQFGFSEAAGDGCRDNGRTVLVADVVLHDEDRADAALFASDDRTEVRVIDIAPSDGQFDSFLSLFETSLFTSIVLAALLFFKHVFTIFPAAPCRQDMRGNRIVCTAGERFFLYQMCETIGNLLPNGEGWYIICVCIMTT